MHIVRERINERFTDESDPIHDMGIGMLNLNNIAKKIMDSDCKKEKRIDELVVQKEIHTFYFVPDKKYYRLIDDNKTYFKKLLEELDYMYFFKRIDVLFGSYIITAHFKPEYKHLIIASRDDIKLFR